MPAHIPDAALDTSTNPPAPTAMIRPGVLEVGTVCDGGDDQTDHRAQQYGRHPISKTSPK